MTLVGEHLEDQRCEVSNISQHDNLKLILTGLLNKIKVNEAKIQAQAEKFELQEKQISNLESKLHRKDAEINSLTAKLNKFTEEKSKVPELNVDEKSIETLEKNFNKRVKDLVDKGAQLSEKVSCLEGKIEITQSTGEVCSLKDFTEIQTKSLLAKYDAIGKYLSDIKQPEVLQLDGQKHGFTINQSFCYISTSHVAGLHSRPEVKGFLF